MLHKFGTNKENITNTTIEEWNKATITKAKEQLLMEFPSAVLNANT